MREDSHESIRLLFEQVIDLPARERVARLDRTCSPSLRPRLDAMLAAAEADDSFLADPPPGAAPTLATPLDERPGTMIGRYKLLEQIGEGGFGVVFLVEQREPVHRRVALKIIKLGMDTKAVIARFEAERQALAMMAHPNIAHVLEAGATETGRPYFVMELVKGEPITRYCDARSLGIPERLALFTQVCHAVQHAHSKGVIHRDLKPSNILVSTQDERPLAKVIDFGIAKATDHRLTERTLFTEHRALIGTPAYMSPEQAEGSLDIDTRSDVYALGVLLYELLTGATPFDAQLLRAAPYGELQRIIREDEPPKPSTRISTLATIEQVAMQRQADPRKLGTLLRGELDWIVMKCLEKDRTRRYETANGLAADVQRHLDGEPVVAAPPSKRYRVRKMLWRYRVPVAVASAFVLLLIGATAVSLRFWQQAEERERQTQQVAQFQAAMLTEIDVEAMGRGIKEHFREQVRTTLERQYVGEFPDRRPRTPEEIEAELGAFDQRAAAAPGADVARRVLDEFVLARAADALEEQFADQPLVQASLHSAIGATYFGLGLYREAEPHLRATLDDCRGVLGDDHLDTLIAIGKVGCVLQEQARYAEAEPYFREALESCQRVLGDDHPQTLQAMDDIGSLFYAMGSLDKAEPYHRAALEGRQRVLGNQDKDTLISMGSMGLLRKDQGRLDEAEQLCRDAMEGFRNVLEDDDPVTLISINNLGTVLQDQRKYNDAERFFREALEGHQRVQGNEHPATLVSICNMGGLLHRQGKLPEAEEYLRKELDLSRRLLGDENADTLLAFNKLGRFLQAQNRMAEAESFFAAGTRAARAGLGDHPITALIEHHHAEVLHISGRIDEALDLAQASVNRYRSHPDWNPDETEHARRVLIATLRAAGREAEAIEVIWQQAEANAAEGQRQLGETEQASRRLADMIVKTEPDEVPVPDEVLHQRLDRFAASLEPKLAGRPEVEACVRVALGYDYGDIGDLKQAETHLQRGLEISLELYDPVHPRVHVALHEWAWLVSRKGEYAEAVQLYRKDLAMCQELVGDEHPQVARHLTNLARVLADNGDYDEAKQLLEDALTIARKQPEIDDALCAKLLHHLALCLDGIGKPAEALPRAQESIAIYRQQPDRDDFEYAHALTVLAQILCAMREFDEAEKAARESVETYRENESWPPHRRGFQYDAVQVLSKTLLDAGNPDEAILIRGELVDDLRRLLPPGDLLLASALASRGELLVDQDRDAEAEPALRECVEIREMALQPDSQQYWKVANARSMLGEVLAGRAATLIESDAPAAISKFTEAERLLVESANWLTRNPDRIHKKFRAETTRKSLQRAVRLYESWDAFAPESGKAERAAEWRAELEKLPGS